MTSPRHYRGQIRKAAKALRDRFGKTPPDVALILGSGLGAFSENLSNAESLSYSAIPGFPKPTVAGHADECVYGTIGRTRVLVFRGRFHFYEGHSLPVVTLPVRAAGAWGVKNLVVTNAAGCLHKSWKPGSPMVITDHINLLGQHPLRGPNLDECGPRFTDMTHAYDVAFQKTARSVAKRLKITLHEGVYAAMSGPSYETPAEIRMLGRIGADAVGMSTVPEVLVARHQDMRVMGVSCLTNWAAGLFGAKAKKLSHDEVMEHSKKGAAEFVRLLSAWIKEADL